MVSTVCAGLLLLIAGCSLKVCPFFYKTSRGLLCLHWTLINFLVSTSGSQAIDSKCLLISLATLFCLLEHVVTVHKPEYFLTPAEQMVVCSALLCLDGMCSMYGRIANTEISLVLLLSHFTLGFYIWIDKRNIGRKLTTQERVLLGSVDLFADPIHPFAFLGLQGFHYSSIVLTILFQVPYLNSFRVLHNLIYLVRSIGTLSMLATPAFLGGFIHFLKSAGSTPQSRLKTAKSEVFNA